MGHNVSVLCLRMAQPSRVQFLTDADDNKHSKTCAERWCARCLWFRRRKVYRKATAMRIAITDADKSSLDPHGHSLSLAYWCVSAKVDGKWGLECASCSKLPESRVACNKLSKWATHKASCRKLEGWALVRQTRTLLHTGAVAELLGLQRGPSSASVCGAPPIIDLSE